MRTEDLQRKDWLYYKGRFNAFPFQVEQITRKKIGYHAEPNENKMYYLHPSEVYPIPLTKEWMARNFPLNEEYQLVFGSEGTFFYQIDANGKKWNLVWIIRKDEEYLFIEDDPLIKMRYIHELQHVLKLCGINKEITL